MQFVGIQDDSLIPKLMNNLISNNLALKQLTLWNCLLNLEAFSNLSSFHNLEKLFLHFPIANWPRLTMSHTIDWQSFKQPKKIKDLSIFASERECV